jgi:hypothetical protein
VSAGKARRAALEEAVEQIRADLEAARADESHTAVAAMSRLLYTARLDLADAEDKDAPAEITPAEEAQILADYVLALDDAGVETVRKALETRVRRGRG